MISFFGLNRGPQNSQRLAVENRSADSKPPEHSCVVILEIVLMERNTGNFNPVPVTGKRMNEFNELVSKDTRNLRNNAPYFASRDVEEPEPYVCTNGVVRTNARIGDYALYSESRRSEKQYERGLEPIPAVDRLNKTGLDNTVDLAIDSTQEQRVSVEVDKLIISDIRSDMLDTLPFDEKIGDNMNDIAFGISMNKDNSLAKILAADLEMKKNIAKLQNRELIIERFDAPVNKIMVDMEAFGVKPEVTEKLVKEDRIVQTVKVEHLSDLEVKLKNYTPFVVTQKLLDCAGVDRDLKSCFVLGDDSEANRLLNHIMQRANGDTIRLLQSKLDILSSGMKDLVRMQLMDENMDSSFKDLFSKQLINYKKQISQDRKFTLQELDDMIDTWCIDYCSENVKKLILSLSNRNLKGLDLHYGVNTRSELRGMLEFKEDSFLVDFFCLVDRQLDVDVTAQFSLNVKDFEKNLSVWNSLANGKKDLRKKFSNAVTVGSIKDIVDEGSKLSVEVDKAKIGQGKGLKGKLPGFGKPSVAKQKCLDTEFDNVSRVNDSSARDRILKTVNRNLKNGHFMLAVKALRFSLPHDIWLSKEKCCEYFDKQQNSAFEEFSVYFSLRMVDSTIWRRLLALYCIQIKLGAGLRKQSPQWLGAFERVKNELTSGLALFNILLNTENDFDVINELLEGKVTLQNIKVNRVLHIDTINEYFCKISTEDLKRILISNTKRMGREVLVAVVDVLRGSKKDANTFVFGFSMAINKLMHMLNGNTISDDVIEFEPEDRQEFVIVDDTQLSPLDQDIKVEAIEKETPKPVGEQGLNFSLLIPDKALGEKIYFEDLKSAMLGPVINFGLAFFDKSTGPGWSTFATTGKDEKGTYLINTEYPQMGSNAVESLTMRHDARYFNARNEQEQKFADFLLVREGNLMMQEGKLNAYEELQVRAINAVFSAFGLASELSDKERELLLSKVGQLQNRETSKLAEKALIDKHIRASEVPPLVKSIESKHHVSEAPEAVRKTKSLPSWKMSLMILFLLIGFVFADDWGIDNLSRNRIMHALNGNMLQRAHTTEFLTDLSEADDVLRRIEAVKKTIEKLEENDVWNTAMYWPKGTLLSLGGTVTTKNFRSTEQFIDRFDTTNVSSTCQLNELSVLTEVGDTADLLVNSATIVSPYTSPRVGNRGVLLERVGVQAWMTKIMTDFQSGELNSISSSLRSTKTNVSGQLIQNLVFDATINANAQTFAQVSCEHLLRILLYAMQRNESITAFWGMTFEDRVYVNSMTSYASRVLDANLNIQGWPNTVMGGNVLSYVPGGNWNIAVVDALKVTSLLVSGSLSLLNQAGLLPVVFTMDNTLIVYVDTEDSLYNGYLWDVILLSIGFPVQGRAWVYPSLDMNGNATGRTQTRHDACMIVGNSQGKLIAQNMNILLCVCDYGDATGTVSGLKTVTIDDGLGGFNVTMNSYIAVASFNGQRYEPLASSIDRAWFRNCAINSVDTVQEAIGIAMFALKTTNYTDLMVHNTDVFGAPPAWYQVLRAAPAIYSSPAAFTNNYATTTAHTFTEMPKVWRNCLADPNFSECRAAGIGGLGMAPNNNGNIQFTIPIANVRSEIVRKMGVWRTIDNYKGGVVDAMAAVYGKANFVFNASKLVMGELGMISSAAIFLVGTEMYNMRNIMVRCLFHIAVGDRGECYKYAVRPNVALGSYALLDWVDFNLYQPYMHSKLRWKDDKVIADASKFDFEVNKMGAMAVGGYVDVPIRVNKIREDYLELIEKLKYVIYHQYSDNLGNVGVITTTGAGLGKLFGWCTSKTTTMAAFWDGGFAGITVPIFSLKSFKSYNGKAGLCLMPTTPATFSVRFAMPIPGSLNGFQFLWGNKPLNGALYLPIYKTSAVGPSIPFGPIVVPISDYLNSFYPMDNKTIESKLDSKIDTIIDPSGSKNE